MTYDITGDWDEKAMFDSPLYPHEGYTTWSWEQTRDYWKNRGVPTEKMVFGIPSFGFEFKGATGPGTDFTKGTAKQVPYKDIVTNSEWEFFFDSVSVSPYGVSSTGYVTFEDPHSSAVKSRWVKDNGYAGIMVWEVSHDYIEAAGRRRGRTRAFYAQQEGHAHHPLPHPRHHRHREDEVQVRPHHPPYPPHRPP